MLDKEKHLKLMLDTMVNLQEIKNNYIPASPGWILANTAQGHLKSLHHLCAETNFDDETLGVRNVESNNDSGIDSE